MDSKPICCVDLAQDFSKLNAKNNKRERNVTLQEAKGSSGETFGGMFKRVYLSRPRVVVLENVDGLAQASTSFDYLWNEFASMGYHGSYAHFNSKDFGLPQSRARIFMVLIDMHFFRSECHRSRGEG